MVKYGNMWGIDPATVPESLKADWDAIMGGTGSAGNLVRVNNWVYNGTLPTATATQATPFVPTAAMTNAGIPTEYQTVNGPGATGGGLPVSLGGSVPDAITSPVIPGAGGGTSGGGGGNTETVPASSPPESGYEDFWKTIQDMIAGIGRESQGSNEPFLPSSSTSELSQALQDRAMQMLNRDYGYSPEEEAEITERQMNRFNQNLDSDLQYIQDMAQAYGWGGAGGQTASAYEDYFGKRSLAESDLMGQLAEMFVNKRQSDENSAIQNALGINNQIYGQQRGDFADMLSLMNFNQGAQNDEFARTMEYMKFMSDEDQRNFLNQQGISDRETQDYFMGLSQQWDMNVDSQNAADRGLYNWMQYANQFELTPENYLSMLNGLNSDEMGMYTDAMRSYLGEDSAMNLPLMLLISGMMGGNGSTVNVNPNSGGETPGGSASPDWEMPDWLQNAPDWLSGIGDAVTPDWNIPDWLKNAPSWLGDLSKLGDVDWSAITDAITNGGSLPSGAETVLGHAGYEYLDDMLKDVTGEGVPQWTQTALSTLLGGNTSQTSERLWEDAFTKYVNPFLQAGAGEVDKLMSGLAGGTTQQKQAQSTIKLKNATDILNGANNQAAQSPAFLEYTYIFAPVNPSTPSGQVQSNLVSRAVNSMTNAIQTGNTTGLYQTLYSDLSAYLISLGNSPDVAYWGGEPYTRTWKDEMSGNARNIAGLAEDYATRITTGNYQPSNAAPVGGGYNFMDAANLLKTV